MNNIIPIKKTKLVIKGNKIIGYCMVCNRELGHGECAQCNKRRSEIGERHRRRRRVLEELRRVKERMQNNEKILRAIGKSINKKPTINKDTRLNLTRRNNVNQIKKPMYADVLEIFTYSFCKNKKGAAEVD